MKIDNQPREQHQLTAVGWLRAAVLGANDGIVSTASLVLGVASSQASHRSILIAGVAGLVAGAMSMATGEYVSVHSQVDAEEAALAMERRELAADPHDEQIELAQLYQARGLDPELAGAVAAALTRHDALDAHARDELGIRAISRPRPVQAALVSAASFAGGALLPLMVILFAPVARMQLAIAAASLCSLAVLGGVAALAGGAAPLTGALRVVSWSALSMAAAAGVGMLFGEGG